MFFCSQYSFQLNRFTMTSSDAILFIRLVPLAEVTKELINHVSCYNVLNCDNSVS
uniref:Uncharacterized protein n=1 Tax=Arundo donax TaxID=35708 RepID=A0A0A9ASX0_ARUDO